MADPLTALPNRAFFVEHLERRIERGFQHADWNFALLALALDRFAPLCETLGSRGGELLLIETAARLQSLLPETSIAARLIGAEFMILLEGAHTLLDVNQQHLDAIRDTGLSLDTDDRPHHIESLAACRPEEATDVPDLLMIFTKTHQIAAALGSARHLLGPKTWILTLQNGLGNVEAISAFIPRDRILVGITTIPADFLGPAHIASHGEGQIRMGYASPNAQSDHPGHRPFNGGCILCQVVDLFHRAGLRATADPNVWAAIWEKAAFNAAFNALCAVTGCTVEQIGLVPSGPEMALAVVAETIAVARASGIPADLEHTQALVQRTFKTHAGHQPSMLQDILAARRTEIDSINGAIVRAARERNLPVPYTAMLWTLVSLIDARLNTKVEQRPADFAERHPERSAATALVSGV